MNNLSNNLMIKISLWETCCLKYNRPFQKILNSTLSSVPQELVCLTLNNSLFNTSPTHRSIR